VPGVQYVTEKDAAFRQNLLNSCAYFFLFQLTDSFTIDAINKIFGEQIYSVNADAQESRAHVFTSENLHTLATKYEHITACLGEKIIYKGYTPYIKQENVTKDAENVNYQNFLEYKNQGKK